MRMHAWGVYSFIKRAQAVPVNLAVLAEKTRLRCLASLCNSSILKSQLLFDF